MSNHPVIKQLVRGVRASPPSLEFKRIENTNCIPLYTLKKITDIKHQQVHLRTIMEKLQPIDKKVRYQIDKLLEKTSAGTKTDDATRFGPNVDDLEVDGEDGEEEENDGLYRAPRMAAVMYDPDDSKSAKEERKREKAEARLKKSAILKDLHEEWTDQPLKRSATGAAGATGNEELEQWQKERVRYEEENFVRLQPTKKRKKQIKAASRAMNSAAFGDLTDFGDIELLREQEKDAIATASLRRDHQSALHRQINQLEQKRRQIRKLVVRQAVMRIMWWILTS